MARSVVKQLKGKGKAKAKVSGTTSDTERSGDITGQELQSTQVGIPAGVVLPFAGTVVPEGYLACDGTTKARSSYPSLFAAIGTTFNTGGEASTDFRLPGPQGRAIGVAGAGSGLTTRALGAKVGGETHVHGMGTHTHPIPHKHKTTNVHDDNTGHPFGNGTQQWGTAGDASGANIGTQNALIGPQANKSWMLTDNPETANSSANAAADTASGSSMGPTFFFNAIIKT